MANTKHPELQTGEVWLTNEDQNGYNSIGWKTKRKGTVAYDAEGLLLPASERLFPVFVQRLELEDAGIDPDKIWDPRFVENRFS